MNSMPQPKIYAALAAIKSEVGAVAKNKRNTTQGYSFRGIDDIYAAVQLVMAKHGVISVPEVLEDRTEERQTKGGGALIYRILKIRYTFYAEDGSNVVAVVIGEGMDSGDKASNKAMSAAEKYCLIQVLKIPTEEPKDSEYQSHEVDHDDRRHAMTQQIAQDQSNYLERQMAGLLTRVNAMGGSGGEILGLREKPDWSKTSAVTMTNYIKTLTKWIEGRAVEEAP